MYELCCGLACFMPSSVAENADYCADHAYACRSELEWSAWEFFVLSSN